MKIGLIPLLQKKLSVLTNTISHTNTPLLKARAFLPKKEQETDAD